jgi:peptidoglycan L-alanyl-D-glutamate endopeptidase CwlK|tara:strand:+ start:2224 stop:2622 length:399 start_codon:yes stop_codon:yes gene_type:complete
VPKFGKRSKQRLQGVDSKLINVLNEVCKYFDITVIEGIRSQERQNELVAQGKSKTKFGKHVQGKAVDIAPYPIDWNARDDFHYLGGFVLGIASQMGINVRWGGDWSDSSLSQNRRTTKDNNFDDLVHFELKE